MPHTPTFPTLSVERLEHRDTPATLYAIADFNRLIRFDSANPSVIQADVPITGLNFAERLVGLDFRPRTHGLYGLAFASNSVFSSLRLVRVDAQTGATTSVGSTTIVGPPLINAPRIGFDFIAATDRIRVTTSDGRNLRVNPDDATVSPDTPIQGAPDQVVAALAYDRNYDHSDGPPNGTTGYALRLNTTTTTLTLATLGATFSFDPTGGELKDVNGPSTPSLAVDTAAPMGFDIPPEAYTGGRPTYAVFDAIPGNGVSTGLYTLDLSLGTATRVDGIGDGTRVVGDVAVAPASRFAVGSGPGTEATVQVYDAFTGALVQTLRPFPGFLGGVSVAVGQVVGDLTPDVVVGAGPGGGPHVKVYDGANGIEVFGYFAYDPAFRGGVSVALGDVDGDATKEVITGAGPGGGPHVKAFSWRLTADVASFFAFDPAFRGGVSVASGDFNNDGLDEIVTGAGPGGGPHVKVFARNPVTGAVGEIGGGVGSFMAYDIHFRGGVSVAVGDVNADGFADVVVGAGPGGGPHVKAFSGKNNGAELVSFFAFDPAYTGGVRVGVADNSRDGRAELLATPGGGIAPVVRMFNPFTAGLMKTADVLAGADGVSVGGVIG